MCYMCLNVDNGVLSHQSRQDVSKKPMATSKEFLLMLCGLLLMDVTIAPPMLPLTFEMCSVLDRCRTDVKLINQKLEV